jgi:hypothetical protein
VRGSKRKFDGGEDTHDAPGKRTAALAARAAISSSSNATSGPAALSARRSDASQGARLFMETRVRQQLLAVIEQGSLPGKTIDAELRLALHQDLQLWDRLMSLLQGPASRKGRPLNVCYCQLARSFFCVSAIIHLQT